MILCLLVIKNIKIIGMKWKVQYLRNFWNKNSETVWRRTWNGMTLINLLKSFCSFMHIFKNKIENIFYKINGIQN